MTGFTPGTPAFLTRAALTRLKQRRLNVEIDDGFLTQIKRILPARLAGYAEWTSTSTPEIVVRWHWYFDEAQKRFIFPSHGVDINARLVGDQGEELPHETLVRILLRRIRRRHDWQPWLQLASLDRRHQPAPIPLAPLPAAAVAPSSPLSKWATLFPHRDGTNRWGNEVLLDALQVPEHRRFGRIAKIAREMFDFPHTMLIARAPHDPNLFAMEENLPPQWREIYEREQLVLIDPRLSSTQAEGRWTAAEMHAANPAFWNVAMAHGIMSGWVMQSASGNAALVLSRPDRDISAREIEQIGPNLAMLASEAHELIFSRLQSASNRQHGMSQRALPENDLEIIGYLQRNKRRKEIAALIGVAVPTVDRRLRVIRDKLGVDKTDEIVSAAARLGLL